MLLAGNEQTMGFHTWGIEAEVEILYRRKPKGAVTPAESSMITTILHLITGAWGLFWPSKLAYLSLTIHNLHRTFELNALH